MTYDGTYYPRSWSQYTPPIIARPPGSEIVDDWRIYWGLARRMGLGLDYAGTALDMTMPPTSEDLIELLLAKSSVTLDKLKSRSGGMLFDPPEPIKVLPARRGPDANFDVMPFDVADEIDGVIQANVTPGAWPSPHIS